MLEFLKNNFILNIIYLAITFFSICVSYYFKVRSQLTEQINDAINNAEDLNLNGEEKMEVAVAQVMGYVPFFVKPFLLKAIVRTLIQNAFDIIEEYAKK